MRLSLVGYVYDTCDLLCTRSQPSSLPHLVTFPEFGNSALRLQSTHQATGSLVGIGVETLSQLLQPVDIMSSRRKTAVVAATENPKLGLSTTDLSSSSKRDEAKISYKRIKRLELMAIL